MKNLKYYVPVYGTNLRVDKFPEIATMVPDGDILAEHLLAQRARINDGEKYQALQIFVTQERFDGIVKEIKRKTGKDYYEGYIDVVYDNKSHPIIQVAVKAEVESTEED